MSPDHRSSAAGCYRGPGSRSSLSLASRRRGLRRFANGVAFHPPSLLLPAIELNTAGLQPAHIKNYASTSCTAFHWCSSLGSSRCPR